MVKIAHVGVERSKVSRLRLATVDWYSVNLT